MALWNLDSENLSDARKLTHVLTHFWSMAGAHFDEMVARKPPIDPWASDCYRACCRQPRTEAPNEELLEKYLIWLTKQTSQRQIVGMAAEYASLAGNRKCEFLDLTWQQVDRAAGLIRTIRAKQRGKKRDQIVEVVNISPALDSLLTRLDTIRKLDCRHVFPTRNNNQYTDRGFKTLWQRCVLEAIKQGVLTQDTRFTFHDLRAFYATKHKKLTGDLPGLHKNKETTSRVYDRSTEVFRSSN